MNIISANAYYKPTLKPDIAATEVIFYCYAVMKKKIQGRKGRPKIGTSRVFRCSDEDYALIQIAAQIMNCKSSDIMREASIQNAVSIINEHLDELSQIKFDDEILKTVADKYLK